MIHRKLGAIGPVTSAIGLGCMGMSDGYGPADRTESVATIRSAIDAGVTLLDTGDFYASGQNEMLIGEALEGIPRDHYLLSVKFGSCRDPEGGWGGVDGRPDSVRNYLAYSLRRLRVDHIDVYRLARLDPRVPVEDTMGALADCVRRGWIRHIGLSEVAADTIRRAVSVHPIADVQVEYSLLSRGIEEQILPTCRELGIGITAYGVLSRGLLSGRWRSRGATDFRSSSPRFQDTNLTRNLTLVNELAKLAEARGNTAAQIAIAWVLAQGDDIVPIIGARHRNQLEDVVTSLGVILTPSDRAAIEHAIPKGAASGARYPEAMRARLDSERR